MRRTAAEGRRFQVSGRVQGVGYRRFVLDCALELGLSGSVRNMPNGDVEVIAQGSLPELRTLLDQLRQGPRLARVTRVEESPIPEWGGRTGFHIAG